MVEKLSVADVFARAADLIEPEGAWIQGSFCGGQEGCFCLVGAVGHVIGNGRWPGSYEAEGYVSSHWPFEGECAEDVEEWNDTPGRTQAEVVARLREASLAWASGK